eukprot:gene15302-17110_t
MLIEDLFNYQHLDNIYAFLDNIVCFFNRKYADGKEIPQDHIKECLEVFYHNIRNRDESSINKTYLQKAYKFAFPQNMLSEMIESLGSGKVEALKGLTVAVAIATLLERRGFVNPSSSFNETQTDGVSTQHIPLLYQPYHIYEEFQN